MSSSPYVNDMKHILAALQEPGDEQKNPLPEEEPVLYAYKTDKGGVLLTPTRLVGDEDPQPEIIDSQQPAPKREPPYFLYFIFMLLLFLLLDSADATLTALMTPTATITIIPQVKTVTLTSSMQLGKLLSPITLSESQTVSTTGHGHQNAARATGSLTFYNAAFTSQTVNGGTVFTGQDGVQVATDATVIIAANNPPNDGEAHVSAHAVTVGSNGNISALDINGIFSSALYVKNLAPFTNGQDARDFYRVTQTDRDTATAALQAKVAASMTAALQGQLMPGQGLQSMPCTPTVTANHGVGDEAETLEVTVSQTCTAIAYNTQKFTTRATHLLTTQAMNKLGQGYTVSGNVQVTVTKATITANKTVVLLWFTTQGTYVYQLTSKAQQRIETLIAGQPRRAALRLLLQQTGIQTASINGIAENQPLPNDQTHLHLLIVLPLV